MSRRKNSILILGLGNDILGNDAVGLLAARELKKEFGNNVDVAEAALSGFELIDLLEGYEKVLLLDAVVTKQHTPGTVLELTKEQFKKVVAVSPHYMGLPDVFQFAEKFDINLPKEIRMLVMEIEPPLDLREGLDPCIQDSFLNFVERGKNILQNWNIE
jgi:hydrogenase maturation protease